MAQLRHRAFNLCGLVGVAIGIALANAILLSCCVYLLINDESAANTFANCLRFLSFYICICLYRSLTLLLSLSLSSSLL